MLLFWVWNLNTHWGVVILEHPVYGYIRERLPCLLPAAGMLGDFVLPS